MPPYLLVVGGVNVGRREEAEERRAVLVDDHGAGAALAAVALLLLDALDGQVLVGPPLDLGALGVVEHRVVEHVLTGGREMSQWEAANRKNG